MIRKFPRLSSDVVAGVNINDDRMVGYNILLYRLFWCELRFRTLL